MIGYFVWVYVLLLCIRNNCFPVLSKDVDVVGQCQCVRTDTIVKRGVFALLTLMENGKALFVYLKTDNAF